MKNSNFFLTLEDIFISVLNFLSEHVKDSNMFLKGHEGKILKIIWGNKEIYLSINFQGKFELVSNNVKPKVTISLNFTFWDLIYLINNDLSIMKDIHISGEASLSSSLGKFFQEFHLDLEDILAKKTGDLTAIFILKILNNIRKDFIYFNQTLKENIIDYLVQECKILLGRTVFDEYIFKKRKVDLLLEDLEKKHNYLLLKVEKNLPKKIQK